MLARIFAQDLPTTRDRCGNFVIDRDGEPFRYVLNYLRDGSCVLPVTCHARAELLREAEYYQVIAPVLASLQPQICMLGLWTLRSL